MEPTGMATQGDPISFCWCWLSRLWVAGLWLHFCLVDRNRVILNSSTWQDNGSEHSQCVPFNICQLQWCILWQRYLVQDLSSGRKGWSRRPPVTQSYNLLHVLLQTVYQGMDPWLGLVAKPWLSSKPMIINTKHQRKSELSLNQIWSGHKAHLNSNYSGSAACVPEMLHKYI